jgi:GDP-D-mannose 3',5'-epimerase
MGGVAYVYHLADAVGGIDYVFNNQGAVFRRNILINSNVIDFAKHCGNALKGFIYVGTACSFPAHLQNRKYNKGLREEDQYPAAPESAYGWSKLMGEYESLLLESEYGIPVSILSLHNVYGTPCEYEGSRAQVLPSLIRKAVRYPEEKFVVWGSGKQGRAFIHVDDVVDALIATLNRGLGKGLIQVGPDKCTSICEVAEIIIDISGKEIEVQYDNDRPEGDEWRYADYSKARELLGWEPRVRLIDGLTGMYYWVSRQS